MFSQWLITLVVCASWAGGAMALTFDRGGSLGFGGGGTDIPVGAAEVTPTFEPFIQSCEGLRFSATDQICPISSMLGGAALSSSADSVYLDPDESSFYTPLTQSCDGLRFSGTDEVCGFSSIDGLGGGVDLAADGGLGLGDPYPVTQSCDGLRFSGTDEICGDGIARSSGAILPGSTPGGDPTSGGLPGLDPANQVDAPATLALMGLGLIALGYARRRGQRSVSV